MTGQVVDTESAKEFMKEALEKISPEEMDAIALELEEKSRRFQALLGQERVGGLTEGELRGVLRSIFSTRRRAGEVLKANGTSPLQRLIADLLYGGGSIGGRFQFFCDNLKGVEETVPFDLASELLHYTFPQEYWLWTRWMWDPRTEAGALRLVTMDGYDLRGRSLGETYLRVGEAVAFVNDVGEAAGFKRIGHGLFGTSVYLSLVYAVYVYTTLRLRMTQEFNKVMPQFPELSRRLLGVYRMEV